MQRIRQSRLTSVDTRAPEPTLTPEPTPTPNPAPALNGEVEFGIHQQEHKDWNEIKTSIHVRP